MAGDVREFNHLEKYCMFVGYPRSGHSLVGSLIDAHPNAVIAHELDALAHIEEGVSRQQLFQLLIDNSRTFTESGRRWQGYNYEVPAQWQGRYTELKVIGDKKGGASSISLATKPGLLTRLQETIDLEIAFIHVIRNPFDNISTMFRRRRSQDLGVVCEAYFSRCDAMEEIKSCTEPGRLLDVRYEAFVRAPKTCLLRLCDFLGLECRDDYLEACTSVVFNAPSKTRYAIPWSVKDIAAVQEKIGSYAFLQGYSYHE